MKKQIHPDRLWRAALLCVCCCAALSRGATFTVTNTADIGAGSLRQAILDVGNSPGSNSIVFQISGTPPFTIQPGSPLPAVGNPVVIDGTTQNGFTNTPVIEINGSKAGTGTSAIGLQLVSGYSTVRGLAINQFGAQGIVLTGPSNVVQGCYIGTDVTAAPTPTPSHHGRQAGGQAPGRAGRGAHPAQRRAERRRRRARWSAQADDGGLPAAGQGGRRRGRAGHAPGVEPRRAGRGGALGPPGGRGLLRRPHRVRRALAGRPPPHRGAGGGRPARQRAAPGRARVLDPAPPPEADRGVPVAGGGRGAARAAGRGRPRAWPGPSTTTTWARSSSCSTPSRRSSASWR